MGNLFAVVASMGKDGKSSGAGGVKVDNRVGVSTMMKAAARVGSMVGVETRVGVGGASISGISAPREIDT